MGGWKAYSLAIAVSLSCLCITGSSSVQIGGERTLVLLEDQSLSKSHSTLLNYLRESGHDVTVTGVSDSHVRLARYGASLFDNVLLIAPSARNFGRGVQVPELLKFVDNGGNLFVVGDSDLADPVRELAAECGLDFDDAGSAIIDHWNYSEELDNNDHTTIFTSNVNTFGVAGRKIEGPILFRGVGHAIAEDNMLASTALRAESTAYAAMPNEPVQDFLFSSGERTRLASIVQARNNARMAFIGSLFAVSDDAFSEQHTRVRTGNEDFAKFLVDWTFQRIGVLRAENVTHNKVSGEGPEHQLVHPERRDLPRSIYPEPEIARESLVYRVKDEIEYHVDIQEFRETQWVPFQADDVQLEFVMLNPYVRTTMTHDGSGHFVARFKAPDSYGIFTFRVMYRRPGFTTLTLKDQVSLRPFRHNEYERFIPSAFPYYAAVFSMMAGFLVLGFFYLYHVPKQQ